MPEDNPYKTEHACRIEDPGNFQAKSFRRIKSGDGKYDIIIGRLKGKTTTTTQAFRYPIETWSTSEARAHCREKGGRFEKAEEATFVLDYDAEIELIGDRFVKIHVIDNTRNLNDWGVSNEGLHNNIDSLIEMPILGNDGRGHHTDWNIGHFVQAEANGVGYGIAFISDDKAWSKIQSGEWKKVSPRIMGRTVICSHCGEDISGEVRAGEISHNHIVRGEGYELATDFYFDHVVFVDNPAFVNAGVVETFEAKRGAAIETHTNFGEAYRAAMVGRRRKSMIKNASVVPYSKLPKAPEDADWSFDANDGNAIIEKGGWALYKKAHCWFDADNPEIKQGYKLPIAKLLNGRLTVYRRGVIAAMGVLMGARGGVDISAADKKSVYNKLSKYYRDFDMEPPEFKGDEESRKEAGKMEEKEVSKLLAEKDDAISKLEADLKHATEKVDAVTAALDASQKEAEDKNVEASDLSKKFDALSKEIAAIKQAERDEIIGRIKELDAEFETEKIAEYPKEDLLRIEASLKRLGDKKPESDTLAAEAEAGAGGGKKPGLTVGRYDANTKTWKDGLYLPKDAEKPS